MLKPLNYLFPVLLIIFFTECRSGLITTSNSCTNAIQTGQADNVSGNYSAALDQFNSVLKKCDAFDAKEKAYAGQAAAYNGMKQYTEALDAANAGLKINKTSLDNLFERANAELGLKRTTDAKADLGMIADLTSKNQNVNERATIYAKMASIDLKQKMYDDAMNNITTAISLNNKNPDLYIVQGDIYTGQGNYSSATDSYNLALSNGGNTAAVWKAKISSEIKSFQKKYSTADAQQLANKMSASDKTLLCGDITTAKSNGTKDINMDLLQVAVCK